MQMCEGGSSGMVKWDGKDFQKLAKVMGRYDRP